MLNVSDDERQKADSLLKADGIRSVEFSNRTYLVEVLDNAVTYWPFLQLGCSSLNDGFCSCSVAGEGETCAHIAAAYQWITKGGIKHELFEKSLFKQLGLICFKRHGAGDEYTVIQDKGGIELVTSENKPLLKLISKNDRARKWLSEKILEKVDETEETSIKFSGLSPDELALWHKGSPSMELGFELSYWSDIFKELFLSGECQFTIEKQDSLPIYLNIESASFSLTMFMAKNNWCEIVEYLDTVDFPYKFHEFQDVEIEKIIYDPKKQSLKIHSFESKEKEKAKKINLGDVYFIEKRGFFPYREEKCLEKKELKSDDIAYFFDHYLKVLKRSLEHYSISALPLDFQYQMEIGEDRTLSIQTYAFTPGDLERKETAVFGSWIFIQQQGFYKMGPLKFSGFTHTVLHRDVPAFIKNHQEFLEGQQGFSLQVPTIQVSLSYKVSDDRSIEFFRDDDAFDRDDNMYEFDPYVYVKEKGFFLKAEPKEMKYIKASTRVSFHEASLFMKDMKDDLEQINGFFAANCPIEKRGLNIYIDDESSIITEPTTRFTVGYDETNVVLFGDFSFVKGEGFYPLEKHLLLPIEYVDKRVISKENEPFFIQFEIKNLEPITLELDHQLQVVDELELCIETIGSVEGTQGLIEVGMHYESVYGKTSVVEVKDFLSSSLPYAPLDIGLVFFDQPRFYWLKLLAHEAIENGLIQITVLEWIRLRIYQTIQVSGGSKAKNNEVEAFIKRIETMSPQDALNLKGLKSVLREYQAVGVNWLWGLYSYGLSGLLADDMGLGKTHQAMALITAVANSKRAQRIKCLVVCPTSVLYHWEDLLLQFMPGLSVELYYGSNRDFTKLDKNVQIILTSYGTLRSDVKKLMQTGFDIAIFDEIQTAKNISSQIHKALLSIKASSKIGLTGTPIENSLIELKALFDIILPKYLPTNAQYKEQFVNPIERYGDSGKKELLSRLVHPFILRRKKSEVLDDLPEKTEEIAYCQLSEVQEKMYSDVATARAGEGYNDKGEIVTMHVFAMLNKLKQVCNHPCLITKDFGKYDDTPCGKWDLFKQLFEEAQNSGEKVVIFTQYLDMIIIFKNFLIDKKIKFASLQGSTRNRREEIEMFKNDPECMVFIGSLKAAGTGIDLTAGSVVIHYDRWWNPAKENQATDRVHRIGQNRGVQVFKMVTRGTIEEYIDELILRKQGLLEMVVGYDDFDQVKKIDKDTLKIILDKISATTTKK